ncbi:MAG: hypothetical protein HY089_11065, partial [Ignavibacteriales bacterium]|nr:hypothetical protein [Ignavibacteriales bacterium]
NITNNQHITGFPLTVALAGTKGGNTSLSFDAMLDRRKEIPVDHYKVIAAGLPVSTLELGQVDFVPSKINNAQAKLGVEISIPGNQFDSNIGVDFSNITMSFEQSPRNDVERIVREVLETIKAFNLKLRFWNTGSRFDMAFATDLDNQLAAQAQKIIGGEIAKLQNEIRMNVDKRIAEKRKEFEALYDQKKNEATARLKSYENLVNEKLAMVEAKKKELQDKVDQEKKKQTDSAKKKLEDALKGLFKKQ